MKKILERLFGKKVDYSLEVIAGITTFLTMAYIIVVNPQVLSVTGMNKISLIAVTCIVTAISTIATGLIANAPIAMAPGMGLNAFFAYVLVLTNRISWPTALGMVFLSGLFFLLLTWFGLRKKLVQAIPPSILQAISVGIGLFITFIGLVNLGIVVKNPATIVSAGKITPTVLIGLVGLMTMLLLEIKKVKGSLIIGIAVSTFLAVFLGYVHMPQQIISAKITLAPLFGKLNILAAFKWSLMSSIFTLMFMDMFDSIGTLVACTQEAGMAQGKNNIPKMDTLLSIDAVATMFGAICGTSTTTAYIESAAGIEEGGRTGLTSVVVGILFLIALFFIPLINIIPTYATAPALILVGLFMLRNIVKIDFKNLENAFPAFIIIVMIALSYSISTGLAFGFLSHVLLKILRGKQQEIKPALWIIAGLSLLYFLI